MGRGGGKDKTTEKSGTSDVVFEKKKYYYKNEYHVTLHKHTFTSR